jgi:DNA invertase Pin-like site-specific DNA recombinase
VTAGIRNARANGKQLGRPKRTVDREEILKLQSQGHSLRRIAATLGCGYGTVRTRLANQQG